MINYEKIIKELSQEDKDYEIWLLFTWARQAVYRAREMELSRYNLSPEQARILIILHNSKEDVTPAHLSRLILLKPHTVSALINRMEKKGLVKKTKDLERKNMVRITLTEKGSKAYDIVIKMGPIHRIIGALSNKEGEIFYQSLLKILTKAGEEIGLNEDTLPLSE
jgi:DNA-binding MarR family transcriptional regulator